MPFLESDMPEQIALLPGECSILQFSDCGSYILSKQRSSDAIAVTNIPSHLLTCEPQTDEQKDVQELDGSATEQRSLESVALSESNPNSLDDEKLDLQALGDGKVIGEFRSVSKNSSVVATSSSWSSEGLELRTFRADGEPPDIFRMAALPNMVNRNSNAEVKLPEREGDSAKIILHEKGPVLARNPEFPIIIERDPRFLTKQQHLLPDVTKQAWNGEDSSADGFSSGERLPDDNEIPASVVASADPAEVGAEMTAEGSEYDYDESDE